MNGKYLIVQTKDEALSPEALERIAQKLGLVAIVGISEEIYNELREYLQDETDGGEE